MTPRRGRWRGELVGAVLAVSLGMPGLGCAQALGITDIIPAGDAPADAGGCSGRDLSDAGAGDFVISFTLRTKQTDDVIALVNQRLLCTTGVFWDARLIGGGIYIEISDIENGLTFVTSEGPTLADGILHQIVISRESGSVQITVDGTPSGAIAAPQSMSQLPPVKIGTDVCLGVMGTVALDGALTNLCVMKR